MHTEFTELSSIFYTMTLDNQVVEDILGSKYFHIISINYLQLYDFKCNTLDLIKQKTVY